MSRREKKTPQKVLSACSVPPVPSYKEDWDAYVKAAVDSPQSGYSESSAQPSGSLPSAGAALAAPRSGRPERRVVSERQERQERQKQQKRKERLERQKRLERSGPTDVVEPTSDEDEQEEDPDYVQTLNTDSEMDTEDHVSESIIAEPEERMRVNDEQIDEISAFKHINRTEARRVHCRIAKRGSSLGSSHASGPRTLSPSPTRPQTPAAPADSMSTPPASKSPSVGAPSPKESKTRESSAPLATPSTPQYPPIAEKARPCRGCGKMFKNGSGLRKHFSFCQLYQIHLCPVDKCGYWYKRNTELTDHLRRSHANLPMPDEDTRKDLVEKGRRTVRPSNESFRAGIYLTRARPGMRNHQDWQDATYEALWTSRPAETTALGDYLEKDGYNDECLKGLAKKFTMWPPGADATDDGADVDVDDDAARVAHFEDEDDVGRPRRASRQKRQRSIEESLASEEGGAARFSPSKRTRTRSAESNVSLEHSTLSVRDLEHAFAAKWRQDRGLPMEDVHIRSLERVNQTRGGAAIVTKMMEGEYYNKHYDGEEEPTPHDPGSATPPSRARIRIEQSPGRAIPDWLNAAHEKDRMSAWIARYIKPEWMSQAEIDQLRALLAEGTELSVKQATVLLNDVYTKRGRTLPMTWFQVALLGVETPPSTGDPDGASSVASGHSRPQGGSSGRGTLSSSKKHDDRARSTSRESETHKQPGSYRPPTQPKQEITDMFDWVSTGNVGEQSDYRLDELRRKFPGVTATQVESVGQQAPPSMQAQTISVTQTGVRFKDRKTAPSTSVTLDGESAAAIGRPRDEAPMESDQHVTEDGHGQALPALAGGVSQGHRSFPVPPNVPFKAPSGYAPTVHAYPSTEPTPSFSQNFFGLPTELVASGASFDDGTGLVLEPDSFVQVIRPSRQNPVTLQYTQSSAIVVAIRRQSRLYGEITALPPLPVQRAAHVLSSEMSFGLPPVSAPAGAGATPRMAFAPGGVPPPQPQRQLFPGPRPLPMVQIPFKPPYAMGGPLPTHAQMTSRPPLMVARFVGPAEIQSRRAVPPDEVQVQTQSAEPTQVPEVEHEIEIEIDASEQGGHWADIHLDSHESYDIPSVTDTDLYEMLSQPLNTPDPEELIRSPTKGSPKTVMQAVAGTGGAVLTVSPGPGELERQQQGFDGAALASPQSPARDSQQPGSVGKARAASQSPAKTSTAGLPSPSRPAHSVAAATPTSMVMSTPQLPPTGSPRSHSQR